MQPAVPKTALSIVAGILTLISGGFRLLGFIGVIIAGFFISFYPRMADDYRFPLAILIIIAVLLLISGVIAIIGGIYTLRRQYWGWALAGAILTFLPFNLLGLASIILVALSRQEFES